MSIKKDWDKFLEYSVTLAAASVIIFAALGMLIVVGTAIVVAKIMVFIK
jgi:hypothetical protein